MVKTVRLDNATRDRLSRAATVMGVSDSEFIRGAIERQCVEVLQEDLSKRVQPVLGIIRSRGGRARRTGEAMRALLRSGKHVQ